MSITIGGPRHDQIPDSDWDDQFDHALAAELSRRATRCRIAFWLLAFVFAAAMLGTTLPTPLYVIYQARWHFSAAVVTVIFAVYAAAVLVTLLLAGRSSDQAGRKSVLAVALGVSALSTVAFIFAPDEGMLLVGRVLSGLSAGLITGTATAMLTELIPASASRGRASLTATAANMGGLGLGPLIAGLFAQYLPHPTTLVFEMYLAVLAVAALCLWFIPETVHPRHRPTLRFAGLGIPEEGRGEFLAAAVAGFAAFALLGLFSSLVPGFIGGVLHQGSHAVQGAVVFGIFAVGAATQVALSRFSQRVVLAGLGLLLVALGLIVAALAQAGMALFLAGTVVGGVAVGAVFLDSLATASRLAPPERRGHVISTFFVACYAGLIIPVVGVGMLSGFVGTFPAVLVFSVLLAALCLFSLARIATTPASVRRGPG
jgi:MFS family permease